MGDHAEQEMPFGELWAIRVDEFRVQVVRAGTDEMAWQIEWDQVEEILVWKVDFFTFDQVCMGFAWSGSNVLKGVDEGMAGWDDLHPAIERQFGVKFHEWWLDVAFPAFDENRRVIWSRHAT